MNDLISIDPGKCIECGACVRDCVSGALQLVDGNPAGVQPDWCNRCSHCQMVCPAGAVKNDLLTGSTPRPVAREKLQAECYREIALTRRSVRHYKDEPLPRAEIEELLEVARFSPTASNTMEVGYVVVTDRAKIRQASRSILASARKMYRLASKPWARRLIGLHPEAAGIMRYLDRFPFYESLVDTGRDPIAHDAPALILIHGPDKTRFAAENCTIAATNLTNYAHARGLGTCYLGLLVMPLGRDRKLRSLFSVPAGRRVYMALALGRPDAHYRQTPVRPPAPVTWV